ncbi:MAG: cell division protein FtsA, partial [Candidatus Nanoarchaeia archaeon]
MPRPKHIISAVDIGTSSIRAIMGALDDKGNIHVIGFAEKNSENSVIKGEIVNIEKATDILFETIQAAENSSSESFDSTNLYVAVTGNHIRGTQSRGTVAIHSPDRKVMPEDVEEASRIASSVSIPPEYMVLNSICGNYVLDDIRRTPHPEGQTANKLEAMSFTIIGNTNCVNSFLTPLREIGYETPKPIFSGLA